MLHRTTWIAVPVVGLVVFGAAAGWWGYFDQNRQRQAMVNQAELQYQESFHSLASHTNSLHEELGKALVSGDPGQFRTHLRDAWRLSFSAQNDLARLPVQLMPMHHVQGFLSTLSSQVGTILDTNAYPTKKPVRAKIQKLYKSSAQISDTVSGLQSKVLDGNLKWVDASMVLQRGKGDNQIVDNFRKLDSAVNVVSETSDSPTTLNRGRSNALLSDPQYTAKQAQAALQHFLGGAGTPTWSVTSTQGGARVPEYIVTGSTSKGAIRAIVSKHGGHTLSFQITHTAGSGSLDFASAEPKARNWLESRGFGKVSLLTSNEYGNIGYFVYNPLYQGVPVTSQGIVVKMSLPDGVVLGYDGTNYFYHPITNLPSRNYSVAQLTKKLNPAFLVQQAKPVIVLDDNQNYQPAVAFYGVSNNETYCVYLNAHTGHEISILQVT